MKNKRNIDNLFEERFNKFEAAPSPQVWENIQSELKKEKDDRKVVPLWVRLGGVAALLALLLTVGNAVFNTSDTIPAITVEDTTLPEKKELNKDSQIQDANTQRVASEEDSHQLIEENQNAANEAELIKKEATSVSNKKSSRSAVASEDSKEISTQKQKTTTDRLIKQNSASQKQNGKAVGVVSEENISKPINTEKNSESLINKEKAFVEPKNEAIGATEKGKRTDGTIEEKNEEEAVVKTENKKSILDAIAEQNEIEENIKNPKPENRWIVAPNVAPVYYSSLGNGSSIDPSFSDNSQSGDVNFSYGVQVSYALSERLSVRSGVSNVDLSYATSGIEVGSGPTSAALRSIDYGGQSVVLTAADKGSFTTSMPQGDFGDITPKSTKGEAKIIQSISYYEVPLELKYALLNSRFGVNLIGGLSTLFLGDNEVSVKADNFDSVLGEANNLSSVSFTTNVGLGLDYKISKKFTFNIEPMFKYQLNPYTDSSVDFKPYYVGVYSGLSFRF